jgi:putative peptidoglycan lipid II flippase
VLLFAVPLGLASLSVISRMTDAECHGLVTRILPGLLLFTVPISIAVAVHSHIIIELIYQRGAFGATSTQLTQTILRGFALGFWAQVISYVLLKTLSARLRNREVFRLMALALAANVVINIGLYRILGPIVLGLGSCAYGLVLMLGAARALDVLSDIVSRLIWLAGGALLYAVCASALPQEGIQAMAGSILLFCVYWTVFIMVSPPMRRDARQWISAVWTRARPSV